MKQSHQVPFLFPLLLVFALLTAALPAAAGKYPYAEFKDTVSYEAVEVLKKYGMPVTHNRDQPWFAISGIPGSYTIWLYRSDEIPQQAMLDIIKLCMDFYEQRGRKESFHVVMYQESADEWRKSLFLGVGVLTTMKPFFELTIKGRE